jgi:hypothetical protein
MAAQPWQELASAEQRTALEHYASQSHWGLALALIGWLHLAAFALCYYLTVRCDYHDSPGYLAIWAAELCGAGWILHRCGKNRGAMELPPLGRFVVRVWLSYFLLAFNLGTLNTLRGHAMFEFFPAMATLASFAFLVMTFSVHRRFFMAVVVMFCSGLLMASQFVHAYLIFALAWWLVLNGIGITLGQAGWQSVRDAVTTLPTTPSPSTR